MCSGQHNDKLTIISPPITAKIIKITDIITKIDVNTEEYAGF
ncbi:hypothetical protein MYAER_1694 [Microcystis aeruginosa NIES-2549]|uniref:Uncharacterized protein n=1 Tax=Microcystis aeruginosa NIES-2549 TaxID=1641812 RepID=A0A0F6U3Q5_MICAE|nr:hypothetical protein MYAER_1694 [Microcystis aeruginosa NIES-2549]AOC52435.1 hypothetical protein amyaer_1710 [Microcystis aeruginosa NIES-2481]